MSIQEKLLLGCFLILGERQPASEQPDPVFNELTRHEPTIQSKSSTWPAVNYKKNVNLKSSKLEPAICSCDIGQGKLRFNRCQLNIISNKEGRYKPRLYFSIFLLAAIWPPSWATPLSLYMPTSNTVSHDNHKKMNSWVSFDLNWKVSAIT